MVEIPAVNRGKQCWKGKYFLRDEEKGTEKQNQYKKRVGLLIAGSERREITRMESSGEEMRPKW